MDMMLGLLLILAGVAIGALGLRIHEITLPLGAFLGGLAGGATIVSATLGHGFLSTTLGLVAGLALGVIAAATAHFFWYAGVVLTAGLAGGVLGAAIAAAVGVEREWMLLTIGLICAAACIAAAITVHYPVYIVIAETSLTGGILAVAGSLLVLDRIDRDEIGTGALWRYMGDHALPWLLLVAIAVAGIALQLPAARHESLPDDRWSRAGAASPPVMG